MSFIVLTTHALRAAASFLRAVKAVFQAASGPQSAACAAREMPAGFLEEERSVLSRIVAHPYTSFMPYTLKAPMLIHVYSICVVVASP